MIYKNCFIIFLSLAYSNMLFTCHHRTAKVALHGVHVSSTIPAIYKDTSFDLKNSFDVFYENDLVLYKLNYGLKRTACLDEHMISHIILTLVTEDC